MFIVQKCTQNLLKGKDLLQIWEWSSLVLFSPLLGTCKGRYIRTFINIDCSFVNLNAIIQGMVKWHILICISVYI